MKSVTEPYDKYSSFARSVGPPGVGSRAIGSEDFLAHSFKIRSIIVKLFNTSGNSTAFPQKIILFTLSGIIPLIFQGEETSAKFVFLVLMPFYGDI